MYRACLFAATLFLWSASAQVIETATSKEPASSNTALAVPAQSDDERDAEQLRNMLAFQINVDDVNRSPEVQELVLRQAEEMIGAAQRLVRRQEQLMFQAKAQIEAGTAVPETMSALAVEMAHRLELSSYARDRSNAIQSVVEIARAQERKAQLSSRGKPRMLKYTGTGTFSPADLQAVSRAFLRKFGRPLPISADGDTSLHRALGFDHRGRVDVAVAPDQPEGIWLRRYLETLRIPYYGFRSAVMGSATAPHIHIGPGSTRIRASAEPVRNTRAIIPTEKRGRS